MEELRRSTLLAIAYHGCARQVANVLLMEELRAADRTAATAVHLFGDGGMQWAEGDLR